MARKKNAVKVVDGHEEASEVELDLKYLKGLKFRGAEVKKVEVDGVKKAKSFPFERDLAPDDVLDWNETDSEVIIVTTDGQKYRVPKSGSKEGK